MSIDVKINEAEEAALSWLRESFLKANRKGFAHSRRNYLPSIFAWRTPYPETSGYIIENFIKLNTGILHDTEEIGIEVAYWLCDMQHEEGYYISGISGNSPSFFNTAQVLFGLREANLFKPNEIYTKAISKALQWLLSCINDEGMCKQGLYKPNYFASYYSRALWPILLCLDKNNNEKVKNSLMLLYDNRNEYSGFNQMGFMPDKPALTHTIAYSWEGFFESGLLLHDKSILEYCIKMSYKLLEVIKRDKKLYGIYSRDWKPGSNFQCVTGQAQCISNFCKAYEYSNDKNFLDIAEILLSEMMQWQVLSKNPEHHGAFPASVPVFGSYFPFQYVNWTNKFFLDACYQFKRNKKA
ncbi:MAG: hypothetical protein HOP11_13060 [Saprospiraceae bacterium]|nr:hypothetical protein [Saprospiraceae bacterium]